VDTVPLPARPCPWSGGFQSRREWRLRLWAFTEMAAKIATRPPDIDAAGASAVLADPVVLSQQAGRALICRRG
jgi:hypothetical protein